MNFVVLCCMWWKDTHSVDWQQTFRCLSKVKIDGLKELLDSKIG